MLRIPIKATPSQSMTVTLGDQRCTIKIDQKYVGGVFLSLTCNDVPIVTFKLCRDRVKIVRSEYLPFAGNLVFIDTQGASDPDYTGLGVRYQLIYIP